jgi:SAM-dependent methyltransferase
MITLCPLCLNRSAFSQMNGPDKRMFLCCDKCKLVFTTTNFMPTRKEEEKRNKQNNNGIQNPTYLAFLNQAIEPALPLLTKYMKGLDYSCGQVPALSVLLEKQDLKCENYDAQYFPEMPEGSFDFIFATGCFESFLLPARELQTIKNLLNPGGFLIILTEKWTKPEVFSRWSYAKDNSRVSFFHAETFRFIAKKYKMNLMDSANPKIIILQKEELVEEEVAVLEQIG